LSRSIFISRELKPGSQLLTFLQQNDWQIHHRSLIGIEPIPFEIAPRTDWIFLSSSNGARIVLQTGNIGADVRIGTVGQATAETVRSFGREPEFIGNSGDMRLVGQRFAKVLADRTVMFLGAEGGSETVRSALPKHQVFFTPVYRTISRTDIQIPETEVVFLTSPSNARVYLQHGSLEGRTVIAIGNTTADFLRQQGVEKIHIPSAPAEEHVIGLLRRL